VRACACVRACVCDLESSTIRRHKPKLDCCTKNVLPRTHYMLRICEQIRGYPMSEWLAFWSLGAVLSDLYLGRVADEWRLTGVHLCGRNMLIDCPSLLLYLRNPSVYPHIPRAGVAVAEFTVLEMVYFDSSCSI